MNKIKILTLSSLLSISVLFSGCYGSFRLLTSVHEWNGSVSDNQFVQELVFLGLVILPVYSLSSLIDVLILNTVEFWTGSNPLSMKEGEEEIKIVKVDGEKYKVRATKNQFEINPENGSQITLNYEPTEASWYVSKNGQTHRLEQLKFANSKKMIRNQLLN
jgi:hypothetical protein